MKTVSPLFFLLLLGMSLSSCMQNTALQVLQPAEMRMPDHINTIVTIDRSKPASGFLNVLEGLFTGESIGQDRRGRLRALDGLTHSLTRTPRFQVRPSDIEMDGTNTANRMAPPLPWAEIESICRQYDADAVVAIERFDSDAIVATRSFEEKYKDKEGVQRTRTRWEAAATLNVTIGWRLYDPQKQVIEDEFSVHLDENYSARGDSERQARSNLPDPVARSFDLSYRVGQKYGMRIAPVWISVSRPFFTNGKGIYKDQMKEAARLADSGNWDAAARIWTEVAAQADVKTAGRAFHNLAVASERLGQLEKALELAEKAWLEYGNKTSRNYMGVLDQRILDERKARSQIPSRTMP